MGLLLSFGRVVVVTQYSLASICGDDSDLQSAITERFIFA